MGGVVKRCNLKPAGTATLVSWGSRLGLSKAVGGTPRYCWWLYSKRMLGTQHTAISQPEGFCLCRRMFLGIGTRYTSALGSYHKPISFIPFRDRT